MRHYFLFSGGVIFLPILPACGLALQERKNEEETEKGAEKRARRTRVESSHQRKLSRPWWLCKELRHIQWATGPILVWGGFA